MTGIFNPLCNGIGRSDGPLTKQRLRIILTTRIYQTSVSGCVGAFMLICIGVVHAIHPVPVIGQSDPIVVEHADTWRGAGVDEEFHLTGHVHITHGATVLTSDSVRWLRTKGELVLDGNVRVVRQRSTLIADHVVYLSQNRRVVAEGAVQLLDADEGTMLTGERAVYLHRPRHAVLTGSPRLVRTQGNDDVVIIGRRLEYFFAETDSAKRAVVQDSVTVIDRKEHITVTCDRVEYTRAPEWALLTGSPRLVKRDTDQEHEVVVTGGRMTYAFTDKQADVYDSVRVTRGLLQGISDTASYASQEQRAHLTGRPVLREGNNELLGDDIVIHLADNRVTQAVITGNAIGTYAPDDTARTDRDDTSEQRSTIQGRVLTVSFDEETVRDITASQNATSIYRPVASSSEGPPGYNEVSAARITVLLDHGRLLQVIASGSVVGTYKPPREQNATP